MFSCLLAVQLFEQMPCFYCKSLTCMLSDVSIKTLWQVIKHLKTQLREAGKIMYLLYQQYIVVVHVVACICLSKH